MTGHNIVIMTDNCSFLFLLEAGAGGNNQYWMNCICFLDKSQNLKTQAILLRVITMKIEGYIELFLSESIIELVLYHFTFMFIWKCGNLNK